MPLSTTQGKPPRQSHADAVLWYELSADSGTFTVTSDRNVISGVPNLLACVYDPSDSVTIAAFVNGVRSGENASVGAIQWSTETPGQCVWGGGLSAHTDECPGIYSELGGDSRAYDSTELAEMYRRGVGWPR